MLKKTLSKRLSEINKISRKQAEVIIKNRKVYVNGEIETRPFISVVERDKIEIQKEDQKEINVLLFHKPKGCITSKKDEKNRTIVYDFLPKKFHNFHYIGRLDYNSEGLLLITNNGDIKRYFELPKNNFERSYKVKVQGKIDERIIRSVIMFGNTQIGKVHASFPHWKVCFQ